MQRPNSHLGMRHVALFVEDLEKCVDFYVRLLGMEIEWQPDEDNVYLTSAGMDNLALHRFTAQSIDEAQQRLDHIGFIVKTMDEVDQWFTFFESESVVIVKEPKTHRDGARSFYCKDPAGVLVQVIYHPPISSKS